MSGIQKMINDGVGVIIGFFVFGMLLSALLYPMASSYQNIVFQNATNTYIKAPVGAVGGDIVVPYFVYVILSNMVLFASIAILLIILTAVLVYMKFKA